MQHQSWARYGQPQSLDARSRQVAQAQNRPILLSANHRSPVPAKVLAKQPIATQKLQPQKAMSPRTTLLVREVDDRAPRSPSSVSSLPSASMSASMKGRSGYHSPQEMPPADAAAGLGHGRREAINESQDKISGSSPSHLASTCSTSASARDSLPLGALRDKLRELLPKDLQERCDATASKGDAPNNAGSMLSTSQADFQAELKKEQMSREALAQKVQELEERLHHATSSMSQVAEARNATDSATDAMLNALRRGMEEIGDRCGTLEAEKENGACTVVRLKDTEAKFNQMLRKMEALTHSADSSQGAAKDQDLVAAVHTLQSQFQVLQAEKRQVAEGLSAMAQKQLLLETMQQELREKIPQVTQTASKLSNLEGSLALLQAQQKDLAASVQGVANMYQACPEHVGSMDKVAVATMLQPIQQCQQQQAKDLQELKALIEAKVGEENEVATMADALSMLCTKVDELANANPEDRFGAELGTIAKALTSLTDRVDQLEAKGNLEAHPVPSSASSQTREQRPRAPSPRRWLQEPLFVSVGRRSDVPGILQSNDPLSRNSVLR